MEPEWLATLLSQVDERRDPWVLLEGQASVEAALAGWWEVAGVLMAEGHAWEVPAWSGLEVVWRPRAELDALGDATRHEGVLGIGRIPRETAEVAPFVKGLAEDALLLVVPVPDEPMRVGEMLRLAEERGAAGAVIGAEGMSPFEKEAVSGSGGATFRMPVRIADAGQMLRSLKGARFRLIGVEFRELQAGFDAAADLKQRRALVCGGGGGLSPFWQRACDLLAGDDWQKPLDDD